LLQYVIHTQFRFALKEYNGIICNRTI
jgi:hypothetical protein